MNPVLRRGPDPLVAGLLLLLAGCGLAGCGRTVPRPAELHGRPIAPAPVAARAGEGARLSALGGRLSVWMPGGARREPKEPGLMSASEAEALETRLVLDDGAARLVTMVYEDFCTAGDDFERLARAEVEHEGQTLSRLAPRDTGLRVYKIVPSALRADGDATLVRGALVVHDADRTVELVAVYLNAEAARSAETYVAVADRVIDGLAAGPRRLAAGAGVRRLDTGSATRELEARVPAGYVAFSSRGPDFLVHRLRRIAAYGGPGASVGVYLGEHAASQYAQSGSRAPTEKVKGRLLGREVDWTRWTEPGQGGRDRLLLEAMAPCPAEARAAGVPAVVHVWLETEEPGRVAELQAIAESLALVTVAKGP